MTGSSALKSVRRGADTTTCRHCQTRIVRDGAGGSSAWIHRYSKQMACYTNAHTYAEPEEAPR